jgi:hypothetical protein
MVLSQRITTNAGRTIELTSPLKVEPDPQGGWQLIFWAGECFDYTTPFRLLLSEIAERLGQNSEVDLVLPAQGEYEDFVEGTLRFGDSQLRIYFEHSLSYLALMNDSEETLQKVTSRVSVMVVEVDAS